MACNARAEADAVSAKAVAGGGDNLGLIHASAGC